MKYLQLLNLNAEETAKTNNELSAKEAHISMQAEILNTEKQIAQLEASVRALKSAKPFEPRTLMNHIVELEIHQKRLERLNALLNELF